MTKIPKSKEAEQIVLGSLLYNGEEIGPKIIGEVKADQFYWKEHRIIYKTISELYEDNKPIEIMAVSNKLEEKGKLNKANGREYLADLSDKVITTANIEHYIDTVQNKATLRQLIKRGKEISELGRNEEQDVTEVLDKAEEKIFDITKSGGDTGYSLMSEELNSRIETLEELHHSKEEVINGIPTGFSDLDYKLSGLKGGQLITMAGRPGMGKTSLALAIARHAAMDDLGVGVISLEMSKDEVQDRILCGDARVNLQRARNGDLSSEDFGKLTNSAGKFHNKTIAIEDTPHLPVVDVKAKARRMKAKDGVDIIVVDYLQLMQGSGGHNTREQEVSSMTRSLKGLARELDIPIISVSQLNREAERRQDKRPKLADLRESGAIEQDSDIVLFVYRDGYYNDSEGGVDETEIIIAKQRNGPLGTIRLAFHKSYASFYEMGRR